MLWFQPEETAQDTFMLAMSKYSNKIGFYDDDIYVFRFQYQQTL